MELLQTEPTEAPIIMGELAIIFRFMQIFLSVRDKNNRGAFLTKREPNQSGFYQPKSSQIFLNLHLTGF